MQGTIATYHAYSKSGVIRAKNGELLMFCHSEWSPNYDPVPGMLVVFEPGKRTPVNQHAFKIKPAQGIPWVVIDAIPASSVGNSGQASA